MLSCLFLHTRTELMERFFFFKEALWSEIFFVLSSETNTVHWLWDRKMSLLGTRTRNAYVAHLSSMLCWAIGFKPAYDCVHTGPKLSNRMEETMETGFYRLATRTSQTHLYQLENNFQLITNQLLWTFFQHLTGKCNSADHNGLFAFKRH